MNKLFLILCFVVCGLKEYAQNAQVLRSINYCLVFCDIMGNPTEGLDILDTNKIINVILNWGPNQDTNVIDFDDKGRIKFLHTQFENSYIEYESNDIRKRTIPFYPTALNSVGDSLVYLYQFNHEGYINQMSLMFSDGKHRSFKFLYQKLPNGLLVEMTEKDSIVRSNLFLYDDHNKYFQWEIILKENIFFKFKRDSFGVITSFENDTKFNYVEIENVTFTDFETKSVKGNYPDQYSLFDGAGDVFGTIHIERLSR